MEETSRRTALFPKKKGWFDFSKIDVIENNQKKIVLLDEEKLQRAETLKANFDRRKAKKAGSGDGDRPLLVPGETAADSTETLKTMGVVIRLKRRIRAHFELSLTLVNSFLSVISCFNYIALSYVSGEAHQNLRTFDLVMSIYFLIDYCILLCLAEARMKRLLSFDSFIDVITVTPIFLTYVQVKDSSFLSIFSAISLLRLLRLKRLLSYVNDETWKQLSLIILNGFSITVAVGEIIRVVENVERGRYQYGGEWKPQLEFFDTFYFIIVTITTVGFGDVAAVSDNGRAIVVCFILAEAYYVPKTIARLNNIFSKQTHYERKRVVNQKGTQTVVIITQFSNDRLHDLKDFVAELFNEDHGTSALTRAIVLGREGPDKPTLNILQDQDYSYRMEYITGDPMNDKDLLRANVHKSKAVFILTAKSAHQPKRVDFRTIFTALSIKKFLIEEDAFETKIYMQLIESLSEIHWKLRLEAVFPNMPQYDEVLVVDRFKHNMLAKSCFCPGFTTLIGNLVNSSTNSDENVAKLTPAPLVPQISWPEEFHLGEEYEIYYTPLSEDFTGIDFLSAATEVYRHMEVTMFALDLLATESLTPAISKAIQSKPGMVSSRNKLILNPGKFVIPDVKLFNVHAFVIARNRLAADLGSLREYRDDLFLNQAAEDKLQLAKRLTKIMKGTSNKNRMIRRLKIIEPKCVHQSSVDHFFEPYLNSTEIPRVPEIGGKTVKTTLEKDFPNVRDHIILFGQRKSLAHFILPLINDYPLMENMDFQPKIVLVSERTPTYPEWQKLAGNGEVYFSCGNPLRRSDLEKAGALFAKIAIILPRLTEFESETRKNEIHIFSDSNAVFGTQTLRALNPNIRIITQFGSKRNMEFLIDDFSKEWQHSRRTFINEPKLILEGSNGREAAGDVYSVSMLDTLLCQMLFNPKLFIVIQALIDGPSKDAVQPIAEKLGDPETSDAFNAEQVRSSNLFQIDVPVDSHGKTYERLFERLGEERQLLPIALYRSTPVEGSKSQLGNRFPYVYTNPARDTRIYPGDKVFVLGLNLREAEL